MSGLRVKRGCWYRIDGPKEEVLAFHYAIQSGELPTPIVVGGGGPKELGDPDGDQYSSSVFSEADAAAVDTWLNNRRLGR